MLEGKPTKLQELEVEPLFEQAKAYGALKQSEKNKADGEAFLSKNAKADGYQSPSGWFHTNRPGRHRRNRPPTIHHCQIPRQFR